VAHWIVGEQCMAGGKNGEKKKERSVVRRTILQSLPLSLPISRANNLNALKSGSASSPGWYVAWGHCVVSLSTRSILGISPAWNISLK